MASPLPGQSDDDWVPTSEPVTEGQIDALMRLLSIKAIEGDSVAWEPHEGGLISQTCPHCGKEI